MNQSTRPKLAAGVLAITFALGVTTYLVVSAQERADQSATRESITREAPAAPSESTTVPEGFPDTPPEGVRALYSSKSLVLEEHVLGAEFFPSSKSGMIDLTPESGEGLSNEEAFLFGSKSGVIEVIPEASEATPSAQPDVFLPSSKFRPLQVLPESTEPAQTQQEEVFLPSSKSGRVRVRPESQKPRD